MKAAVVERPGVLAITNVPEPTVGEHDVLVKVRTASICNATDNHILNGTFKGGHDFYPQILGHETHGEVIAAGSQVKDVPLGKRIVFYTPRGAFCEYTTLDTSSLPWAYVPDEMSHAESPLCEMFHGAFVHTVRTSQIKDGEKVVVIGQGPMGLVVTQCLKAMAQCTVAAIDFQPFRLKKAKELGADRIYDRSQLGADEIVAQMKIDIGEVDLAIVCTDRDVAEGEGVYDFATRLLRRRGRMTGLTVAVKGNNHSVNVGRLFEKHILFKRRIDDFYPDDPAEKVAEECRVFQTGVDWVRDGQIDLAALITHRIPLEDIAHGLYLCRARAMETIKVVVEIG
jgi:threonine dehydrogenase-like Zn-dependent dehydrogenase